jgi:hypothetical protein
MGEKVGRTTQSPYIYSVYREQPTEVETYGISLIIFLRHITDEHFAEFIL